MVLAELTHTAARGAKQVRFTFVGGLISALLFVCAAVQLFVIPREAILPIAFCGVVAGLVAWMFLYMAHAYRRRTGQRLLRLETDGLAAGELPIAQWADIRGITVTRAASGRPRPTATGVMATGILSSTGIADGVKKVELKLTKDASQIVDVSVGASPAEFEAFVTRLTAAAAKHGIAVIER